MKLNFWKSNKEQYEPSISFGSKLKTLKQQFEGEVENNTVKFPTELGLEHPFDFKFMENIWKGFGLATAVVDKYVDFIVGPGFFIRTQSPDAEKILNQFLKLPLIGRMRPISAGNRMTFREAIFPGSEGRH